MRTSSNVNMSAGASTNADAAAAGMGHDVAHTVFACAPYWVSVAHWHCKHPGASSESSFIKPGGPHSSAEVRLGHLLAVTDERADMVVPCPPLLLAMRSACTHQKAVELPDRHAALFGRTCIPCPGCVGG